MTIELDDTVIAVEVVKRFINSISYAMDSATDW